MKILCLLSFFSDVNLTDSTIFLKSLIKHTKSIFNQKINLSRDTNQGICKIGGATFHNGQEAVPIRTTLPGTWEPATTNFNPRRQLYPGRFHKRHHKAKKNQIHQYALLLDPGPHPASPVSHLLETQQH